MLECAARLSLPHSRSFFSHSSNSDLRQSQSLLFSSPQAWKIDSRKLRTRGSGITFAISLGNAFHHSIYGCPHHILFHLTSPFSLTLMQWIATKQLMFVNRQPMLFLRCIVASPVVFGALRLSWFHSVQWENCENWSAYEAYVPWLYFQNAFV